MHTYVLRSSDVVCDISIKTSQQAFCNIMFIIVRCLVASSHLVFVEQIAELSRLTSRATRPIHFR
jgi:hypothetical protein